MLLRLFIFLFPLILTVAAFPVIAQSEDDVRFPKEISITIDRNKDWGYDDTDGIEEGDRMSIRCTFQNKGRSTVSLLLSDHDPYHGTMSFPFFMLARVTDTSGKVVTQTKDFGDWWTMYYLWSSQYTEMPGERISLKPQEKVVRIVPLKAVLSGLESLPNSLMTGEYKVQLKLGDIVSNTLRLKIIKKKE